MVLMISVGMMPIQYKIVYAPPSIEKSSLFMQSLYSDEKYRS